MIALVVDDAAQQAAGAGDRHSGDRGSAAKTLACWNMTTEVELRAFLRRRKLVRFKRRFDGCRTTGYIGGVGADLVLVVLIDDRIRFDGFQVIRRRDVTDLAAEPRADFIETVLARREERRPSTPRVRLHGFAEAIRDAGRRFPLLSIHRERVDPDVCHIGSVSEVTRHRVVLREIDPGGCWEDELSDYSLKEITRVDFAGGYEEALSLFGDKPPQANLPRQPASAPSGARG